MYGGASASFRRWRLCLSAANAMAFRSLAGFNCVEPSLGQVYCRISPNRCRLSLGSKDVFVERYGRSTVKNARTTASSKLTVAMNLYETVASLDYSTIGNSVASLRPLWILAPQCRSAFLP